MGVGVDAVGILAGELGVGLALDEEVDDAVEDADVGDADGSLPVGGGLINEMGRDAGSPVAAAVSPVLAVAPPLEKPQIVR